MKKNINAYFKLTVSTICKCKQQISNRMYHKLMSPRYTYTRRVGIMYTFSIHHRPIIYTTCIIIPHVLSYHIVLGQPRTAYCRFSQNTVMYQRNHGYKRQVCIYCHGYVDIYTLFLIYGKTGIQQTGRYSSRKLAHLATVCWLYIGIMARVCCIWYGTTT